MHLLCMKKTAMAVAALLAFGLFAAAFSLAPAIAQYANPGPTTSSDNTSIITGNATGCNGTVTAEQRLFSAKVSQAWFSM